jgi:hypothetical protein
MTPAQNAERRDYPRFMRDPIFEMTVFHRLRVQNGITDVTVR